MNRPRTICVSGARGGHGASTVAAALALYGARHQPTALVAHDRQDMAALLGLPIPAAGEMVSAVAPDLDLFGPDSPAAPTSLVVIDAGSRPEAPQMPAADESYVVVRGPCYLALRSLVRGGTAHFDGVILVNEPARSLRASDVADVLGLPVVAEVAQHPAVARCLDAGLLPTRVHRLQPLAPLHPLALDPPRRPTPRRAAAPATTPTPDRTTRPIPERTTQESGTDLPCPLFSGHGGRRPGVRARIGATRRRVLAPRGGPARARHRKAAARRC